MFFDLFKKEEAPLNIEEFLGFDTKSCKKVSPEEQKELFIMEKDDQASLHISRYYQVDIHAGAIPTTPDDLTPYFDNCVRHARKIFNTEPVLFLQPHLYTDQIDNQTIYSLPRVFTCAILDRPKPLEDETNLEMDMTSISVAWWQDSFGKTDKHIIEALFKIEWKRPYAWSWKKK
jgi:hypothetical protein